MSVAVISGTAASATSVSAGRRAVSSFLAPHLYLILLGALDASLAHLLVVLDLSLRKLSVFPEDDVEAKSEYAESDKNYGSKQDLHLVYKA